jgi:hypothetical protein
MKIEGSAFSVTGKDNDRHNTGTVLIEFTDAQVATFEDVREDKFENWVESDYDPDLVPVDMSEAWQPWAEMLGDPEPAFAPKSRTPSDDEEEEDDEDEEWDDEEEQEDEEDEEDAPIFHPLDFIGQATGFPTQGFDLPVIADDDLMGHLTGFPTPGWGAQPTPNNDANVASATNVSTSLAHALGARLNKRRQE